MARSIKVVLVLGSGPSVVRCRDWSREPIDQIVAINNAWAVRPDWDVLLYPEDFPKARLPTDIAAQQRLVGAEGFVPAQNRYGGFVFAGGTMAFTTAYWVLDALQPDVIAFLGCDMVYDGAGKTHFYGRGAADPLRKDITLRDLGAKSARLAMIAAAQGCSCVNLSEEPKSALLFPRVHYPTLRAWSGGRAPDAVSLDALRGREAALGYDTPDGRYWEDNDRYDAAALAALDVSWRALFDQTLSKPG